MTTNTLGAEELTFIRLDQGYTRDDLVHILDVDPSRLRRWENGKEPIPPGIAADLATAEARAAAAAVDVIRSRAADVSAQLAANKAAGIRENVPYEPLIVGPIDDAEQFWHTWPEHKPMPPRWWWNVAARVKKYGVPVERGRDYSR